MYFVMFISFTSDKILKDWRAKCSSVSALNSFKKWSKSSRVNKKGIKKEPPHQWGQLEIYRVIFCVILFLLRVRVE